MAHLVNRRGYWSLEESIYRPGRTPGKRVLAYYGKKFTGFIAAQQSTAEERAYDSAMRIGAETERLQKAQFGETATERKEREAAKNNLPSGLHLGPTPAVEVEKAPSPSLPDAPAPSENEPDVPSASDAPDATD